MSNYTSVSKLWDDMVGERGSVSDNEPVPELFNLEDIDDDEEVKQHLETKINIFKNRSRDFAQKCAENLMFYKGGTVAPVQSMHRFYTLQDAHRPYTSNQIALNLIHEFVEFWVNKVAEFSSDIDAIPGTSDPGARDLAEAKKKAIQDYNRREKMDAKLDNLFRQVFTFGESYAHYWWDYNKGPVHPEFLKLNKKFKSLQRVSTESGEDVNIDRKPRIGDVQVDIIAPIYVFHEDKPWDQVYEVILNCREHVDKLRSDYPDFDIKGSGIIDCWWVYHTPTRYLQEGRFIKYCGGSVVENVVFPYARPVLPVCKVTDIDIIGSGRGRSFLENIKAHQLLINEMVTATWDNMRRAAKGKWVYEQSSVNPAHLAPESPGIPYKPGMNKPDFVPFPAVKGETISFIELLRENAEKQARIHAISQGTPPPNIRSGLQFAQLEEQQQKAVEIMMRKRESAVIEIAEGVAMIMSTFYRPDDGRTTTLYGRGKQYMTEAINTDALSYNSPIVINRDPSKTTGRISQLAMYRELHQEFPDAVPDELIIDMLDSGRYNNYADFGGSSIETALFQIGQILKDEQPSAPEPYEDLVLKWQIFVGTMRQREFLSYSEEQKEQFKDHVLAIETLLIEDEQSVMVQQKLQTLEGFPVYYKSDQNQYADDIPATPDQLAAEGATPEAQLQPEMNGEAPLPV